MDPEEADLFFIPLDAWKICAPHWYSAYEQCGISYRKFASSSNFWSWMHEQPSWQSSDGSNHFIIAAQQHQLFAKGRVCFLRRVWLTLQGHRVLASKV
jgi:hypothetical protein